MAEQCQHTRANGERCRGNAAGPDGLCFAHSPALSARRKAACRAGGKARSRRAAVLPADTPVAPLGDAKDVGRLLEQTVHQLRTGALDVRVANGVGYLCSVRLKALEAGEVEERLGRVEALLAQRHGTPASANGAMRQ
jgi:hypothetical protein